MGFVVRSLDGDFGENFSKSYKGLKAPEWEENVGSYWEDISMILREDWRWDQVSLEGFPSDWE